MSEFLGRTFLSSGGFLKRLFRFTFMLTPMENCVLVLNECMCMGLAVNKSVKVAAAAAGAMYRLDAAVASVG